MQYEPHQDFIAPARRYSEIWRTVVGTCLVIGCGYMILMVGGLFWLSFTTPDGPDWLYEEPFGTSPGGMLYLLLTLGAFGLAVLIVVRFIHDRDPLTLVGALPQAWADFRAVCLALGAFYAFWVLFMVLPFSAEFELEHNPDLSFWAWMSLLPVSLLAVLIQTTSEELAFRGYLQQQLAARFRQRWVWIGIPTLLFGAGHYSAATYGPNAWFVVVSTGLFALIAADLTARTGNLGAAVAFHFINNVVAFIFLGTVDEGDGLALYTTFVPADLPWGVAYMVVLTMMQFCAWLAARVALRV